jgi:hypothetical protein
MRIEEVLSLQFLPERAHRLVHVQRRRDGVRRVVRVVHGAPKKNMIPSPRNLFT